MPPSLAALLFSAFIAWLLYHDSKQARGMSASLWIPTIWIGILASKPVTLWVYGNNLDQSLASYASGSALDRNVSLALTFSAMVILMNRRIDWSMVYKRNGWLWLFYLYSLVSVLWSDYPSVAFKRLFRDASNVLMFLIILTEKDPVHAIRAVFVRCAYILIPLSVLFIKYYLDIGRYYNSWTGQTGYGGVTTNKNSLGVLVMLCALVLLWSVLDIEKCSGWLNRIRRKLPELLLFAMCIWLLAIANSQTALVCFCVGVAVFFASRTKWIKISVSRWKCCAWCLVILSLLFFCVPSLREIVANSVGRRGDLTQRTDIWVGCLNLDTSPLIGVGFASFWLTKGGLELGRSLNITEAHNGYLETYLNGGLIGVLLLLAVLLSAAGNTVKQLAIGSSVAYLYAALLLSCIIYNYTEATFNNTHVIGVVLWLIAIRYPLPVAAVKATGKKRRNLDGAYEYGSDMEPRSPSNLSVGAST